MFNKIPTAAIVITVEDPPKEINGSGNPFVGRMPHDTPILIAACSSTQLVIPEASSCPNKSGENAWPSASRATPRTQTANDQSQTAPINPNSSPMIGKIKSVCGSGSDSSFSVEAPSPFPHNPPEPNAIIDWVI